jgi:type IV pilus assembly protein PilB
MAQDVTSRSVGTQLADMLVEAGHLSADQLRIATRIHAEVQATRTLTSVLLEKKAVTPQQLRDVLRSGTIRAPLGDLLVELGLLAAEELELALAMQCERPGAALDEILVENHFLSEHELIDVLAGQLGLASVSLDSARLDSALLERAPVALYKSHTFLPLRHEGTSVVVVFAEPSNIAHLESARRYFGKDLIPALATRKSLRAAIARGERQLTVAAAAAQNPE